MEVEDRATRIVVRLGVLAWFIIASWLFFAESCQALRRPVPAPIVAAPPLPPEPAQPSDEEATALYAHQVTAYTQHVTAYSAYAQAVTPVTVKTPYELVVKETLMPIVERIIIGLLGFAFIAGAAGVINNANRMRRGIEPERITLI